MIKVKRVYDAPSPEDGKRILVDRLWPRGLKKENAAIDEWMKDAAPSSALRKWFSHDPEKWQDFKKRYLQELKEKTEIMERLRKEAGKEVITLLFSARDSEHNNAVALKEAVERRAPGKSITGGS
ncbi:MAG: DUF488 domain-containing protein [Thermodesulfovibrionales bacterium]